MESDLNFLHTVREDDFIEYYVFPSMPSHIDSNNKELHLKSISNQIEKIVEKHSVNYLWHRDEFKVISNCVECKVDGKHLYRSSIQKLIISFKFHIYMAYHIMEII